jgi:hypothetical protein
MGNKKLFRWGCWLCLMSLITTGCETVPEQRSVVGTNQIILNSKETTLQEKPHKPVPIPVPQTLRYAVGRVLGRSNRGVVKVYKIENIDKNIEIIFTIDDNLTDGMIRDSAKIDVVEILKAVQSSGYDYAKVTAYGTFPLMDKFGNSEESVVIKASYTCNTINRINWQNFLYDNVYGIADSVWLHPTFR